VRQNEPSGLVSDLLCTPQLMKHYWVVSPNVRNSEKTASAWRQSSVLGRAAFMGWPASHQIGRRFVDEMQAGDVILIARRHHFRAEIVASDLLPGGQCGR
jgi:hypothetical protein